MAGDDDSNEEPTGEPSDHAGASPGFGPLSGGFQAFTDMQRQGIAAATEVAERFTAMLDGFNGFGPLTGDRPVDAEDDPADETDGDTGMGDLRASVARSVDLYTRLFQNTFEAYADMVEGRMRARGVRIGADNADTASAIGPAGGVAVGQLWVHNDTDEPVGPLHLRVTGAEAASGAHVEAASLAVEPAEVEVPAGSSVAVGVAADLSEVEAGHYHAFVLISEEPQDALPLVIVAQPGGAEPAP